MWVEERCTMVTSAPPSHSAAQMSCAELLEPITTTFLPGRHRARMLGGMLLLALEDVLPLELGQFALPDMPVASTSCFGFSTISLPSRSTTTVHSRVASS
jgi:hypothetical protein